MGQTPPRPSLDELARERIKLWMASHNTTQAELGDLIGRNQAWMSRYLSGDIEAASLETLDKIAKVFKQSIGALLDSPTDPDEMRVIEAYRAVPAEERPLALRVLQKFRALPPPRRGPRKR